MINVNKRIKLFLSSKKTQFDLRINNVTSKFDYYLYSLPIKVKITYWITYFLNKKKFAVSIYFKYIASAK